MKVGQDRRPSIVEFSVSESFGGPPQQGDSVEVRWWGGEGLEQGDEFLVYAYRDEESGAYETESFCGESESVSHAAEDLEFLRKQKRGEIPTTLSGAAFLSQSGHALQGVEITILGENIEQTLLSDANGRFELSDLAPGNYVGLASKKEYIPSQDPYEFEVFKGACSSLSIAMATDTQVGGTVIDAWGLPANGVKVQMSDGSVGGDIRRSFPTEVLTDSAGRFVFRGVQPGEYRIGVNIDLRESPSPFAPTYFPGVSNKSEAGVIRLGWGQHIDNIDFQLASPPLKKRSLNVRVVWPDNSPVVGTSLTFDKYGRGKCQYFGLPRGETDTDGRISTEIFQEGCYRFKTGLFELGSEPRGGESDWFEISPGDEPVTVELVLKPPR